VLISFEDEHLYKTAKITARVGRNCPTAGWLWRDGREPHRPPRCDPSACRHTHRPLAEVLQLAVAAGISPRHDGGLRAPRSSSIWRWRRGFLCLHGRVWRWRAGQPQAHSHPADGWFAPLDRLTSLHLRGGEQSHGEQSSSHKGGREWGDGEGTCSPRKGGKQQTAADIHADIQGGEGCGRSEMLCGE